MGGSVRTVRKIYNIFFAICLIITGACFNQVESGAFVVPEYLGEIPYCAIETDTTVTSEDVCTVEMLGNQNSSLLSRQVLTKCFDKIRKSEEKNILFINSACLQSSFHICFSAETNILASENEIAEVIQFIHNKDGKKKN